MSLAPPNDSGSDAPLASANGAHPKGPVTHPAIRLGRRSANIEARQLLQQLVEAGAATITFTKARVVAELIYVYVAEALREAGRSDLATRVRPYRGGYLPNERREIEQALFTGELLGVCSTNALELGIDVGGLDAAVLVGFPSTLCSLWQQAGRAGRRQAESVVFFVAYDDPVDQYLMRRPEFLFERGLEHAVIDPDNPHVLARQIACAACELPLAREDLHRFGPLAEGVVELSCESGRLRWSGAQCFWASPEMPAAHTNLRTISEATVAIVDTSGGGSTTIGQVDAISAPEQVYPEAIYLHRGESFTVRQLDQAARIAYVERVDVDYYTQPVLASEIRLLTPLDESPLETAGVAPDPAGAIRGTRGFAQVSVRWQTIAFRKFRFLTMEMIGQTVLELDPLHIDTVALWLEPPADALAAIRAAGFRTYEALAGVRNMLLVALPPLAMADRHDLGGVVDSAQLGRPVIFVYDRYPGGIGYARHGFEHAAELLWMAYELVRDCPCDDGCPGCVGPPNLRVPIHHDPDVYRGADFPDKQASILLLERWLGSGCVEDQGRRCQNRSDALRAQQ